jgi:hypothetical protein
MTEFIRVFRCQAHQLHVRLNVEPSLPLVIHFNSTALASSTRSIHLSSQAKNLISLTFHALSVINGAEAHVRKDSPR